MNKVFLETYLLSTIQLARELDFGKDPKIDEHGKIVYLDSGRIKKEGNALDVWAKRINYPLKHHDARSDTDCCRLVHRFLHTGEKYEE